MTDADEDPIIPANDLDQFLEMYGNSAKDTLLHATKGNKAIGLLIYKPPNEEDENGNPKGKGRYEISDTKKPNVDLLTMSIGEKIKFHENFPDITVNPKYSRPLLFFWPGVKKTTTKEKADIEINEVEVAKENVVFKIPNKLS